MTSALPAFGEADLSNCEREQIHLAGSIQPHGALLVLDETTLTITQASANAPAFLNSAGPLLGRSIRSLPGTLAARLEAHLTGRLDRRPIAVRASVGEPGIPVDALLHRASTGGLVIELELAGEAINLRAVLGDATQRILDAASLRTLCDEAASQVQRIAGYDRVMVYRFDELGHGEVFSECRRPDLEAFLGNRYPASDIPQIARRLYLENRVRLLVDVAYEPVSLEPRAVPSSGDGSVGNDLDMSMCALRSMSLVHLQYLKNMGVCATLVLSLVVGGELWGLIACHHYAPRFIAFETRSLCEVLAEIVATRVAALESFVQTRSELAVRRLEQTMVEAIARDGDWRTALFDGSQMLMATLKATGVALVYEGQVQTAGDVPATQMIRQIAAWLDMRQREPVLATAALAREEPSFAPLVDVAAGLLATPISSLGGEYLIWFRPERVRTVTWGGDPRKPVIVGTDPRQLSPRLSFAQWHEVVKGTADPWTRSDHVTARLMGATVADMILQFRSVRMLIAQDQLAGLTRQLASSTQPIIVADATGGILLINEAFRRLLPADRDAPDHLEGLPLFVDEPLTLRRQIEDLLQRDRSFRSELALITSYGGKRPLAVRAEPVSASLERKLGYMLHFEELAERKAAESARRQFQDGMIDRRSMRTERLDANGDRDYQAVLASVVENAQIAALEITYGVDVDRLPAMLGTVRASVTRTADLLEHLLWHAGGIAAERE